MHNQRTNQQSRSIHKLYDDIAAHCVAHGIDQKVTLDHFKRYETPVTPEFVKSVWKTIQFNMFGTDKTSHMTTDQVDKVYEVFCKFWSQVTHHHFPFPSLDSLNQIEHYENMS